MNNKSIKEVRQKTGADTFTSLAYYGAYGRYIEMNSGLSLEEEMKVAGPGTVEVIDNGDDTFTINQTYNQNSKDNTVYRKVTTITPVDDTHTVINEKLYFGDELIKEKNTTVTAVSDTRTTVTGVLV